MCYLATLKKKDTFSICSTRTLLQYTLYGSSGTHVELQCTSCTTLMNDRPLLRGDRAVICPVAHETNNIIVGGMNMTYPSTQYINL